MISESRLAKKKILRHEDLEQICEENRCKISNVILLCILRS